MILASAIGKIVLFLILIGVVIGVVVTMIAKR
jgi:hypothetical protein